MATTTGSGYGYSQSGLGSHSSTDWGTSFEPATPQSVPFWDAMQLPPSAGSSSHGSDGMDDFVFNPPLPSAFGQPPMGVGYSYNGAGYSYNRAGDLFSGAGGSFSGAGGSFSGAGGSFSGAGGSFSGTGDLFSGAGGSFSGTGDSFSFNELTAPLSLPGFPGYLDTLPGGSASTCSSCPSSRPSSPPLSSRPSSPPLSSRPSSPTPSEPTQLTSAPSADTPAPIGRARKRQPEPPVELRVSRTGRVVNAPKRDDAGFEPATKRRKA